MKKKIALLTAVLLIAGVLLYCLQALLVPKFMENREGALISEYYDNAGNNDVVFVGDCEVYENFSPITLWEEYGITSYIRGSPQQMIWQSYYLMEETFQYETPKVMVFNVLSMQYDTPESTTDKDQREEYNRMTLDGMRWSSSKWDAIMASMTEEERKNLAETMFSYIFPILRYHERWSDLSEEDFKYWFTRDQVSDNGYLMQTGVKPMNEVPYFSRPVDYRFGENSWHYLRKMAELCKSKGTQLVLIKAPTYDFKWWDEWDAQIAEFATNNDLLYVNMVNYEKEIGIDWQTDTYDFGQHLNVYGAEKASRWFGKILQEQCQVPDRRADSDLNALWTEKANTYHARKKAMEDEK